MTAPAPVVVALDTEALRAELRAAIAEAAHDPRGELVALRDGWGPLAGSTLLAWSRSGRLRAFRGARGQLLAWEADVRAAVEAEPVTAAPSRSRVRSTGDAALDGLLADDALEAGR